MIVSDNRELAELHSALSRVATARHADAAWARTRLSDLRAGQPLTDIDARRIRVADAELHGPTSTDRATPAIMPADAEEDVDPICAARMKIRQAPSRYL